MFLKEDHRCAAADVWARVDTMAQRLLENGCRRFAVLSSEADTVAIALLASQRTKADILLLRDAALASSAAFLEELGIGALVLDGESDVRPLRNGFQGPASGDVLLTTSGTTGRPKVARHSFATLIGRIPSHHADRTDARWLLTYHPASFAGLQVILTSLSAGMGLVASSENTVPRLADLACRYGPSFASGTPTFWRAFLSALGPRSGDVPLRRITLGGEAVDQSTLDMLAACYPNAGIVHIYASTEAGALFAVKDRKAGFPAAWLETGIDGCRLRIRNGVLEVQSPRAMHGYVDPARRSPFSDDGWIVTGDMVELIGGRVLFRGRLDGLINVGGSKVAPEEIEAVLLEHSKVAEARVFGRPNPITGALVAAEVVLVGHQPDGDPRSDILAHARARLPNWKVPQVLHIVSNIELGATQKKSRS